MSNTVLNIKHKKIFGILFLLEMITDVICLIIQSSVNSSNFSGIEILCIIIGYVPKICVVICLLKPYNNSSNILLSASMILAIFATILCFIDYKTVVASGIVNIIVYAIICAALLSKRKNIKLVSTVITVYIFYLVIFSRVFSLVYSYLIRYGSVVNWGLQINIFNVAELFCILLFLWSVKPVESSSSAKITVDTDVIDFKDLLQFIESEYHSGKITETEYQAKRTEIISKL